MKTKKDISKPLHILSLGAGRQSTALYLLSDEGKIQRFDYAIFGNPGAEKKSTLAYVKYLKEYSKAKKSIPIIEVNDRNLLESFAEPNKERYPSLPFFYKNQYGETCRMLRSCTYEFKILQVNSAIKKLYGLSGKQRFPKTYLYLGIAVDEVQRVKYSKFKWQVVEYPLSGYSATTTDITKTYQSVVMTTSDCLNYIASRGFPIPDSSSCFNCPYHSNSQWQYLKSFAEPEFLNAVSFDKQIRNILAPKFKFPIFLHKSCKPLDEVEFSQPGLFDEICDEGYCFS